MSEYWDRDIVERLRGRAEYAKQEKTGTADGDAVHLNQAADEIGRLRAQIEILRVDVQKWTDAYQLTAALVEQQRIALTAYRMAQKWATGTASHAMALQEADNLNPLPAWYDIPALPSTERADG